MENKLSAVESALVTNDLSKLTTEQRMSYYKSVCESLGLNPLTQPLSYISLNGKLTLYAKRDATDQLRKIHHISINITSRELLGDVYMVTAKAKDASGREDESIGTVSIANLKGDALANAYLKCETKAKRRVTLSICGLGLLDDTEVETIKGAIPVNDQPLLSNETKELPKTVKEDSNFIFEQLPEKKQAVEVTTTQGPPVSIDATTGAVKKEDYIPRYPKKETILINREQADFLKTVGFKFGHTLEQINMLIYQQTKKIRWGDINTAEFDELLALLEARKTKGH